MASVSGSLHHAVKHNSKELFALTGITPSLSSLVSSMPRNRDTMHDEYISSSSPSIVVERDAKNASVRRETTTPSTTQQEEYVPFESVARRLSESIVSCTREHRTSDTTSRPRMSRKQQQQAAHGAFSKQMHIPKFLPCTHYINNNETIRKVFVVDDDDPRKARFSWYDPRDTMVPRGWLTQGLLADINFYFYTK